MKQIHPFLINSFLVLIFMFIGCNNEPLTNINSFDGVNVSFENEGEGE